MINIPKHEGFFNNIKFKMEMTGGMNIDGGGGMESTQMDSRL